MPSRRTFLSRISSILALPAAASLASCTDEPQYASTPTPSSTPGTFDAPVGVQLYSVRNELDEDLEGTLRAVKEAGYDEVETYSFHGLSPGDFRMLLDDVGLAVTSMHAPYERVVDETAAVAEEAHALGSDWVAVAWIPHEEPFDASDVERAVRDFSAAGRMLRDEGVRFAYHCHGYEFREADGGGTLFDRFMTETEPGVVDVEMDVFWVRWPGRDPVELIEKYPGRFPLYHLKDMRSGSETGDLSGHAPLETNVPIGQGMMDIPAIVRSAEAHGAERYYVEYEHTNALEAIRESLAYLRSMEL